MKVKTILALAVIIVLSGVAYFVGSSLSGGDKSVVSVVGDESATEQLLATKPDRKNDVYGSVTKIEGNIVTVSQSDPATDPTIGMSSEEKREYMQTLSQEERTALKEDILNSVLGEVRVLVPVGIPMTKKKTSGPEAPDVEATLADIVVGSVLSVWLDQEMTERQVAEYLRISGAQ